MKKIAVLISNIGTGTNLQAIIDGVKNGKIKAQISAVISDTKDSIGLQRAKKHQLKIEICPKKEDLLAILKKYSPDYICLAGWKQIITDEVIDAYPNRILNTHPGLIPDSLDSVVKNPDGTKGIWNKGKMTNVAMKNFLDSRATYAGCTNHFLSHKFDFGPVLGRCFEKIKKEDTLNSLYTRLKIKENKLYVDVLVKLTRSIKVLITDGGGRGAALVNKYNQSNNISEIFVVPGNDLMQINSRVNIKTFPNLKTTSVSQIIEIAKKGQIDLVDVAQDNAVEAGLVDELNKAGISVFGPTRLAGQIEWDKAWAREFMKKYNIPSPNFYIFNSEQTAVKFVKNNSQKKWFVKASGLAEGKGVIAGEDQEQTIEAISQMKKFTGSGKTFLLEEWLVGEEFSAFAICDSMDFQILGYAQDHKRVNDGDLGPNTGGMGCVSNPLIVDENIKKQVNEIFRKTMEGMQKEGRSYKGVLYLGGMVSKTKVYVIEFNARWGDPEAEVILPSIKNDYLELVDAVIFNKIKDLKIIVDKKVRVAVAGCSKGYPLDYSLVKNKKVLGIEQAIKLGVKVYGAGIKKISKDYVVNGGRVLYIAAEGKDVIEARIKAYKAMELISIEGDNLHYRTDIGWRDLARL